MGKSTPSAPQAPNPYNIANQQTQTNLLTAAGQQAMNNVNQFTPYGNVQYTHYADFDLGNGNKVPQWRADVTLSPEQDKLYRTGTDVTQGAYDLAKAYTGRIADATAKPYSYDGLPAAPVYNEDYRKQQLGNIIARNQPQMDRDRAALDQRLADQGVGLQDPAYRTAMDQYQRGVNDYRLGADLQAGQEASNMYGLQANTRDRAIAEMTNLRDQPINEVSALMSATGQGVRDPTFVNTPQVQVAPTDVTGAHALSYQAQQNAYQQQLQQNNAAMGGLFGFGSALLGGGLRSPWVGKMFGF